MDSTRDLRDALDEADPRTHQAARAPRAQIPNKAVALPSRLLPGGAACSLCHSPPAPGSKLKHCGRCRVHSYCNSTCAKAHWPKHRLACERMVRNREEQEVARAAYDRTHGGRVSHLSDRGAQEWFAAVPGLSNQVALLAWEHRSESPIIHVFANRSDVTGRVLKIRMEPRSCWEGKAGYSELQQQFRALQGSQLLQFHMREGGLAQTWLACERMAREREVQEMARAAYDRTHGGRVSHLSDRGAEEWFAAVPGFCHQVALLAWQHRSESPIIYVSANRSDIAGRTLTIRMEPRSSWEGKAEHTDLQQHFDGSSFRPNEQYMV
eukprot:CAMPEP_0181390630 /NCGR_PEP_ID=MMETSP1106-20121128/25593_1 /TAXON_ID=81844 /ORGANISM="Mantoniella antarctica, Strain SL-175" /LENGTH=322 /DNA_ID=CAMNT_0023511565 /DNA_START=696 /DNA_END=1665 /DNA_ORIENTATION=-